MSDEHIRLQEIDLSQIEKIRKLHTRLTNDLGNWDKYTQMIALQEGVIDHQRAGLSEPAENQPTAQETHERMVHDRTKVLTSLKSAVWSASKVLKEDHDRRKKVKENLDAVQKARAQEEEELELEEV